MKARHPNPGIRVANRVKTIAVLIERYNRARNADRPQHEHLTTPTRKIRKALRNTDPEQLGCIESRYRLLAGKP